MMAIERAAAANPAAAQRAAFSYNAAIAQYRAHDFARARASALMAISESATPPVAPTAPRPAFMAPAAPLPSTYLLADELPATQANAEKYVALAHRAMAGCDLKSAAADYRGAVAALGKKRYRAAMAAARNTVDDCSVASQPNR
jgi:hypothetical protein